MIDRASSLMAVGLQFNTGLHQIARRLIQDRQLSIRALTDAGVVKSRNLFAGRLAKNDLNTDELDRLLTFLEVDQFRAWIAIICMNDAEEYFGPVSETASDLMQLISSALIDKSRDLGTGFDPLRPALCRTVADRTVDAIIEHQHRLESVRAREVALYA